MDIDQPPTFDPAALRRALDDVGGWSAPSQFSQTGVHHGYRQVTLVQAGKQLQAAEPFAPVLAQFAPVWSAWLSWIEPGGFVRPHRDAGPWRQRWQVPIVAAGAMDQDGWRPAEPGASFRVRHWRMHSVANRGPSPRIHLVLDRDVPDGPAAADPFEVSDQPSDLDDLIEASATGGSHAAPRP